LVDMHRNTVPTGVSMPMSAVLPWTVQRGIRPEGEYSVDPYRVLVVCLGNICRSPMAAAMLRARLADASRPCHVASAGFLHSGEPASQPAEVVMAERGLDLTRHLSQQISPYLVQQQDLVLTMEEEQAAELIHMGAGTAHVESLISFASNGAERGNVYDPYGEDVTVYRRVADRLTELVDAVVERLRRDGTI